MIYIDEITAPYSKMLQVSGPDAAKFLQGQLTCDVNATPTYGAYCNIKGRVECFFELTEDQGTFFLSMPNNMLEATQQELQKYAVFSKVALAIIDKPTTRDPLQETTNKIPEVYPATRGLFLPHDLNLPELGAVSFTKGCYRGQEIVARMQHRGKLKRSMHIFTSEDIGINPGDTVLLTEGEKGVVVRVSKQADGKIIGLAVISTNS